MNYIIKFELCKTTHSERAAFFILAVHNNHYYYMQTSTYCFFNINTLIWQLLKLHRLFYSSYFVASKTECKSCTFLSSSSSLIFSFNLLFRFFMWARSGRIPNRLQSQGFAASHVFYRICLHMYRIAVVPLLFIDKASCQNGAVLHSRNFLCFKRDNFSADFLHFLLLLSSSSTCYIFSLS